MGREPSLQRRTSAAFVVPPPAPCLAWSGVPAPRIVGSRVPVERLRRQTNDEKECGFFAIQNLYVWAGLEPPTLEHMRHLCRLNYTTAPEHVGMNAIDQGGLLTEMRFPLLLALGIVPPGRSVRDYFPALLDAGCALLIGYNYVADGEAWGHSVVAESWSDEGVTVLCSGSPKYEGTILEWEGVTFDDGARDDRPHGNRNIVPWRSIETSESGVELFFKPALGIRREFVIVWPAVNGGTI